MTSTHVSRSGSGWEQPLNSETSAAQGVAWGQRLGGLHPANLRLMRCLRSAAGFGALMLDSIRRSMQTKSQDRSEVLLDLLCDTTLSKVKPNRRSYSEMCALSYTLTGEELLCLWPRLLNHRGKLHPEIIVIMTCFCRPRPTRKLASPWFPRQKPNSHCHLLFDYCRK